MKKRKRGFTLIELLVVVAIIGLLVGVLSINVGRWRARARDSQRVSDIRTIQQGLAVYYNRSEYSGAYPIGDVDIIGTDSVSLELRSVGAMSTVPVDPMNSGNYVYHYCSLVACTGASVDGESYRIEYWLETSAISGKSQGPNFAEP